VAFAGRVLALMALVASAPVSQAQAAVISLVPSVFDVVVGDPVVFDVVVSGLGADESVGGVAIQLTGDPAILDAVDFVIDPDDKMGLELDFGSGFGPSTLDLVFLAEDFGAPGPDGDHAALKALQGDGFVLATVSLLAIAPGISPIDIVDAFGGFLSNATGVGLIETSAQDGLVCVAASSTAPPTNCAVPEPGLMALVGAGLASLAVRRRKKA
jgi:hypothetical protein